MEQRVVLRDYTKVRAPYDGIVTARFADPGALIQIATSSATSAIPLFTIMDLNTCGSTRMCRKTIAPLGRGRQDHSHGQGHGTPRPLIYGHCHAVHIGTRPGDPKPLVEIDIPNSDHALRPGTFAEVSLRVARNSPSLVVPPQAVISTPKGKSLFVVEEGKAKSIAVKPGSATVGGWRSRPGCGGRRGRRGREATPAGWDTGAASPFNLPDAKTSQQKFERRAPGGTPPPPGNPLQRERAEDKEIAHEIPIAGQRVPHAGTHVVNGNVEPIAFAAETDQPVTLSRGSFSRVQQAVDLAVKNHPMLIEGPRI